MDCPHGSGSSVCRTRSRPGRRCSCATPTATGCAHSEHRFGWHHGGMTEDDPDAVARRLLVIEDDDELAELLAELFVREGYTVDVARDGQRGLHLGLTRRYGVMVIDRRLPAIEGLDVLVRLRQQGVTARALMLTALDSLGDRVDG